MRDGDNILGRVHNISLNIVVDEGAATGQMILLASARLFISFPGNDEQAFG